MSGEKVEKKERMRVKTSGTKRENFFINYQPTQVLIHSMIQEKTCLKSGMLFELHQVRVFEYLLDGEKFLEKYGKLFT